MMRQEVDFGCLDLKESEAVTAKGYEVSFQGDETF